MISLLLPCKAEITNFQNTVGIDEQVSWLNVSVDYPAAVQVLHSPEDLVEEDLDMVGREMLGGDDDLVEITLHEFSYEVDFLEKVNVRRLKLEIISNNWTKI